MDVAIVLAAGASTRMGAPKALVPYGGVPALARIERACRDAGLPVIAVLGADAPALAAALGPHLAAATRIVDNPDWPKGRTGSLQRGLDHAGGVGRALVWPVDHPLATAATVRALLATPGEWVVPTFAGKSGHPVLLAGAALARVRAADPATPLREVRRAIVAVPVEDEGVVLNLDEPDQAARRQGF